MLLDAHTHFFSRPFFDALAGMSPLPGTPDEKLDEVVARTGIEVPGPDVDAHTARWIEQLDANAVDHAVTFASLPHEADAVAAAVAKAPDRFTGYVLVDPTTDDAPEVVEQLLDERGFKGVLLFPAMHHFHPEDLACRGVFEVLDAYRAVALIHCGILEVKLRDLLGLPRPYDLTYANPLGIVPVANAFPHVPFVIPHFGAGLFRECLMTGVQCENVYVDTSSSNSWRRTQPSGITLVEVFDRALDVFGADRVLFGTDSSTFPRGWRTDIYEGQKNALEQLGASDEDMAKIFGGNARRLLDNVGSKSVGSKSVGSGSVGVA